MLSDSFLKHPESVEPVESVESVEPVESVESVESWRICHGQPPWLPALSRRRPVPAESLSGDVYITCAIS